MAEVTTSTQCKYPDFFIENEAFDWVEFQLVDELGDTVANMEWFAENEATRCGLIPRYTGYSDANGIIKIKDIHPLPLTLKIQSQPLVDEMENRALRFERDEDNSKVKKLSSENKYGYQYVRVGQLCNVRPTLDKWDGIVLPEFHFPLDKTYKGVTVNVADLNKRTMIEICPFRAWTLILHHTVSYSLTNAYNLGIMADLAYSYDSETDRNSVYGFFCIQCLDLSSIPVFEDGKHRFPAIVTDVPFRERHSKPIFIDTADEEEGETQLFYVTTKTQGIVAWRGTEMSKLSDLWTDASFMPVECFDIVPEGKIHGGFLQAYQVAKKNYSKIFNQIKVDGKTLELFICGHSLGGSLALIHSAEIRDLNPLLYTYGMPRTLTASAVKYLKNLTHFRHVNDADTIPSVPPDANLDNWFYDLWGPVGGTLGFFWSVIELMPQALGLKFWECFWHHGSIAVFFNTTQTTEWKECKVPNNPSSCRRIRKRLPIETRLYLVPELILEASQKANEAQKRFTQLLTKMDKEDWFPPYTNPDLDHATNVGRHSMPDQYLSYLNNQLKECTQPTLTMMRRINREKFLKQMKTYESSSPVEEFTRNSAFIEIHDVVASTLDMTRGVKGGNEALEYIKPLNFEEFEL
ncbi:lipase family protein [Citrobacter portucalensis]|uniref:lipase family protein n=1 Tax=Citrobacter portucalensis TaxID=1639133 RepID=UPI0018AAF621|nr:lipase family protein [Citrobacter portucalensis]